MKQLFEVMPELGSTAEPGPQGDYQVLSARKGGYTGASRLDRGASARAVSPFIFGGGAIVVAIAGNHLEGTGRIGRALVPLRAGLELRSAWALDHIAARAFNRGVLTGYFLVRDSLPTSNDPDPLDSVPSEVREFSRQKELDEYLRKALTLAKEVFAPLERLEAEVHQDRETGDEWIVLRAVIQADRVNASTARKKYTAEWVASVPAPQRYLIRLSPDIL